MNRRRRLLAGLLVVFALVGVLGATQEGFAATKFTCQFGRSAGDSYRAWFTFHVGPKQGDDSLKIVGAGYCGPSFYCLFTCPESRRIPATVSVNYTEELGTNVLHFGMCDPEKPPRFVVTEPTSLGIGGVPLTVTMWSKAAHTRTLVVPDPSSGTVDLDPVFGGYFAPGTLFPSALPQRGALGLDGIMVFQTRIREQCPAQGGTDELWVDRLTFSV